jgi:hypothetical protein
MSHHHGSAVARALAAGLGLVASVALPATAQQQISIGTSVTGTLTMSDPVLPSDQSHYKLFTFMGQAGQTVQVDLMSSDFDAYLYLRDQNGQNLAQDDDSGGGLNSRIVRNLPYTGMFQILANTLRAGQYGSFTLSLQASGMAQPVVTQPLAQPIASPLQLVVIGSIGLNQQVQNILSAGAPLYDGKKYHAYNFECTAGQQLQMDLLSDWDNYAIVFDPVGNIVARDDDGGEGLNARIVHACTTTGTYRLMVTTYSASSSTGAYTLRVQGLGTPTPIQAQPQPIAQPVPQPIPTAAPAVMPSNPIPAPGQTGLTAIGQVLRGRLETGDQTMADGTFADIWQFQGSAVQTITIDVRSDEFDTYMQLLDANGNKLGEDDDSGGNLNSRLTFTLPATGMYQIVVNNSGQSKRMGLYTVSIR